MRFRDSHGLKRHLHPGCVASTKDTVRRQVSLGPQETLACMIAKLSDSYSCSRLGSIYWGVTNYVAGISGFPRGENQVWVSLQVRRSIPARRLFIAYEIAGDVCLYIKVTVVAACLKHVLTNSI